MLSAEDVDLERSFSAMEPIRGSDAVLAGALVRLVEDFEYDEISRLIQGKNVSYSQTMVTHQGTTTEHETSEFIACYVCAPPDLICHAKACRFPFANGNTHIASYELRSSFRSAIAIASYELHSSFRSAKCHKI